MRQIEGIIKLHFETLPTKKILTKKENKFDYPLQPTCIGRWSHVQSQCNFATACHPLAQIDYAYSICDL